jgi:predicted flap endonuclease-1-like 5' DNA nuclease
MLFFSQWLWLLIAALIGFLIGALLHRLWANNFWSNKPSCCEETEAKLKTVQSDLDAAIKARDGFESNLKVRVGELAAATAAGAAFQVGISKLTGEKDAAAKALADANLRISKLEGDLKVAGDGGAKYEATLKTRDVELNDLRAKLAKIEGDLKLSGDKSVKADTDLKAKIAELAAATAGGAALQATISKLTGEKDNSAKLLADANARISKLEADLKAAGDTSKFDASIKAKDADLSSANVRIAKLEGDLKSRIAEVAAATAGGAALQATVSKLTGEKDASAKALADANARIAKLEADLKIANDANTKTQGDLKGKIAELAAATAGGVALQASMSKLTGDKDSSAKALADANARIAKLEADLKAAGDTHQQTVHGLVMNKGPSDKGYADAPAKIAALEVQLKAAKDANARTSASLQGRTTELASAQSQLGTLRTSVSSGSAAKDRELAELRAQVGSLRAEVNALSADKASLQSELSAERAKPVAAPVAALAGGVVVTEAMKQATASTKAAAQKNLPQGATVTVAACPQHLSDVKGIGTVYEGRLYAAGIGSYWELANMSDDDFKNMLEIKDMDLIRVPFATTREDATRLAKESNSIGRTWTAEEPDDFEPLGGIGYTYEKRLYDAGLCTYKALAAASVEQLEKVCIPGRRPPVMPDFASWIEQAKKLVAKG